jgi:voltage-gated potassium channel
MVAFITLLVRFVRALGSSWRDPAFRGLFILIVILAFGTLLYRQVERWSLLDSLYFSVVTLPSDTGT